MKICLISPPAPFALEPAQNPPLGLCYLSAYLKAKIPDIEVVGVDFATKKQYNYDEKTYLNEIPRDCNFYGITGFSCQFKWMKEISKFIKYATNGHLILGGPHASACPDETFINCRGTVVQGEGEKALHYLITGQPAQPAQQNSLDLIPDRELFGMKNYHRTLGGNPAVHIMTLRGCPYSCRFCHKSSVGTKVTFRSVPNVLKEIDYCIINTYGIKSFVIYDDIFTLNKERVYQFCDAFRQRGISWRCWSRTNLITVELLQEMKISGLTSITFGVESGDDKILKIINKGTTVEQNRNALLACKKVGVPVRCSLMFGNPSENLESINNTINMIKECQPEEWNLAVLAPVPGSEFWDNPEKYGIKFDKEWVRSKDYLVTNRFGKTGVGDIWIELDSMSKEDMRKNLQYMLKELDKVCPRRIIQDTIQTIKRDEI